MNEGLKSATNDRYPMINTKSEMSEYGDINFKTIKMD
jgi:hypothetical protein